MQTITINTGLKTYEVRDLDGTLLGTLRFNPADLGAAGRWEKFCNELETMVQRAEHLQSADELDQIGAAIRAHIDALFGPEASNTMFFGQSSLALCEDGSAVLENALNALAPIVAEAQQTAYKASETRLRERTAAYEGSAAGLVPGQSL